MGTKPRIFFFFFLGLLVSCNAQQPDGKNYSIPLDKILDSLDISSNQVRIVIDKSDYTLSVTRDTLTLKTYPVVFGGNPVDDKRMEGDQCTPEGDFYMVSKYPHKSWSKFIWINYPTDVSRKKFNQAKSTGEIPATATIGGEIGIHGVPKNTDFMIDQKINWTLGCISMKNKDVEELYPHVSTRTLIKIQK